LFTRRPLSSPPPGTAIYALSLHDALPICLPIAEDRSRVISEGWAEYQQELWDSGSFAPSGSWRDKQLRSCLEAGRGFPTDADFRSEEHTSELQSRFDLVCRLLLEKKNATR